MGDLSRNLSRSEFACWCGCGKDDVDLELVSALQSLRDISGWPIVISSGVRCRDHNAAVGGVPNSYHVLGMAADIRILHLNVGIVSRLAEYVPSFARGGIGLYPNMGFVHVDVRPLKSRWINSGKK